MLYTPFGNIVMLFDDKEVEYNIREIKNRVRHFRDVDGVFYLTYDYTSDGNFHTLKCILNNAPESDFTESGENLEALSFYVGTGKITLGTEADYGNYDGSFDYDGDYLKNGLEIIIDSNTKTQTFEFGVAWLNNSTEKNEVQTWFGADPFLLRSVLQNKI